MYFDQNQVISEVFHFDHSNENNEVFHIAYGVDKNFLFGCVISITSILLNNTKQEFHFHIFSDYLDDDFKKRIELLAKQYRSKISVYIVNCQELKSLPSTKNWSYATYFRFIIADILYPAIDRLLYIDADIICKGSLGELIKLDINKFLVAAVKEKDSSWWQKCAKRLEIDNLSQGYFNAGFLYINLENWQKEDVSSKAMKLLEQEHVKSKLDYLDQDLLNMIMVNNVFFLDKRYNCQYSINYELKVPNGTYYKNPIEDSTIFIHYIGPTKPWHEWAGNYPCSKYFIEAKNNSPWKDSTLLSAKNANQWRYCAKHRFHQGKNVAGLIGYFKYYWFKIVL